MIWLPLAIAMAQELDMALLYRNKISAPLPTRGNMSYYVSDKIESLEVCYEGNVSLCGYGLTDYVVEINTGCRLIAPDCGCYLWQYDPLMSRSDPPERLSQRVKYGMAGCAYIDTSDLDESITFSFVFTLKRQQQRVSPTGIDFFSHQLTKGASLAPVLPYSFAQTVQADYCYSTHPHDFPVCHSMKPFTITTIKA